jgi:hypothetical protein
MQLGIAKVLLFVTLRNSNVEACEAESNYLSCDTLARKAASDLFTA